MQEQGFSQLKTIETIGVIRYLCARQGIQIIEQPASIKKVTEGHMRARGVPFAPGDRHAKDAQLHGLHYIWKNEPQAGGD